MDLLPTQDQQDIADTAADVLGNELPAGIIRTRRDEAAAAPAAAWQRCAETGLLGLGLPEEAGGADCGVPEEALLFREIGRRLSPGPFLSSVLGAHVAYRAGDSGLAERITGGEVQVGMVLLEHDEIDPDAGISATVHVQDWSEAEYVLVVTAAGAGLLTTASLGAIESYPSIDAGVRLGTVTVDGAPFTAWVPAATESMFERGVVLVAAQLVGIAEATRDMSVAYAKTREQFGRPIGVNQAVKHFCANMAVEAERAAAQLFLAAASVQDGAPDAQFQAHAAKVVATDAAHKNSATNIQVHGGMGFTSEFDGHLFVERVEVLENTLSTRYESLATIISLPAAL